MSELILRSPAIGYRESVIEYRKSVAALDANNNAEGADGDDAVSVEVESGAKEINFNKAKADDVPVPVTLGLYTNYLSLRSTTKQRINGVT